MIDIYETQIQYQIKDILKKYPYYNIVDSNESITGSVIDRFIFFDKEYYVSADFSAALYKDLIIDGKLYYGIGVVMLINGLRKSISSEIGVYKNNENYSYKSIFLYKTEKEMLISKLKY